MVVDTNLKTGGFMQVRIENGMIKEIFYKGSVESKTLSRNETDDMKEWLKDILKADVEKFKQILVNADADEEFVSYGKALLLSEKTKKLQKLSDYQRECERKIEQLQKEVEKYDLPV